MRIVFVTSSYPRFRGDSSGEFIRSLAETLCLQGHQVEVVAPFDAEERGDLAGRARIDRFRYAPTAALHVLGHGKALYSDKRLRVAALLLLPAFLVSCTWTLWRVVTATRPGLIHAHWVLPNGIPAMLVSVLTRTPLVVSLHGSDMFVARRNRLFGMAARLVFHRAAVVTACSPDLLKGAQALGASKSVHLLPWGADPDIFDPLDRPRENTSREGPSGDVIVASLGRLVAKKGFEVLLQAVAAMAAKGTRVKLVIGGDGPEREPLRHLADQLGIADRVTLAGHVAWEAVPEFLTSCDVFALPSVVDDAGNQDGLPTVLLEAMAAARPCVASRIGGVELVIRDRVTGRLVTPGDVAELADVLADLASDKDQRERLGQSARDRIISELNWASVCRQLAELYAMAPGPPPRPRLGTSYRVAMMRRLGLVPQEGDAVLDIGCHDGYFLAQLEGRRRIGVDPLPLTPVPGVHVLRADGLTLPFAAGGFDCVYALDVLEHVREDRHLAASIANAVAPGGQLVVTTPSLALRMVPHALTPWIERHWGHTLRRGYSPDDLQGRFVGHGLELQVRQWSAPAFRLAYLPTRAAVALRVPFLTQWIGALAAWDAQHAAGLHGYLVLVGRRPHAAPGLGSPPGQGGQSA